MYIVYIYILEGVSNSKCTESWFGFSEIGGRIRNVNKNNTSL